MSLSKYPESSNKTHIRSCMLYEYRRGYSAAAAFRNITEAYGKVMSLVQCNKWFAKFKNGSYDLKDRPKSGRPTEVDTDVLRDLIETDPRKSSRDLAVQMGISHTCVINHLKNMGKVNKCGIWVPHKLSAENRLQRQTICTSLLARNEVNPFLRRIITGDEKWVLYVNVERKKQWLSPSQTPIPTPKAGLHPKKVLLCVWWDLEGVVHFELLDMNQTINAELYCQQLDRLKAAIDLKRPALANRRGVILQQDNARPHTAKLTRKKLKELGWEILPHPPYSPDIAPSDYYLFLSLQHFLSGKEFKNKEEVKSAITEFFDSKDKDFYRKGIEALPERWEAVIENDGNYIID